MSPLRPHFMTRVAAGSTCWRRVTLVLVAMLAFLHPSLWAEREYPEGPGEFIEQLSPDGKFAVLREVTASEEAKSARFKLISLPDKRVVLPVLASAEAPENGMRRLLWAPDSKRFALHVEVTQRVDTTVIFQRNREEFVEVAVLPNWEPAREAIAKRARQLRWKSAIPTSHIEDSVEPTRCASRLCTSAITPTNRARSANPWPPSVSGLRLSTRRATRKMALIPA